MTFKAETRYSCDRCNSEIHIATDYAPGGRLKIPEGWTALIVESTEGSILNHLCVDCSGQFRQFIEGIDKYTVLKVKYEELYKLHVDAMAAIRRLKYQRDEAYKIGNRQPNLNTKDEARMQEILDRAAEGLSSVLSDGPKTQQSAT